MKATATKNTRLYYTRFVKKKEMFHLIRIEDMKIKYVLCCLFLT